MAGSTEGTSWLGGGERLQSTKESLFFSLRPGIWENPRRPFWCGRLETEKGVLPLPRAGVKPGGVITDSGSPSACSGPLVAFPGSLQFLPPFLALVTQRSLGSLLAWLCL